MSSKLYVGNLSFDVENGELQELFGEAGSVQSVNIIKDRDSGRSKGFGFVEMSSNGEANEAISKFDGQDFKGRTIKVNLAKERT